MHIITPLCYTSNERLEYFAQYIEHVNKLNNLDKFNFLFFVEPDSENMVEMIPSHWNKTIFRNYYRFKPALNHFAAFNYCFEVLKLDYVFLLEDDIICSPDLYDLSMYCLQNKLLEDNLLCTLNKHELYYPDDILYKNKNMNTLLCLTGNKYVSCWGTGVSKTFWYQHMYKQWRMDITFDATIDSQVNSCSVISPLVSRTNQIGKVGLNYYADLYNLHNFDSINIHAGKDNILYNCVSVKECI
jgi:hypothetical protein